MTRTQSRRTNTGILILKSANNIMKRVFILLTLLILFFRIQGQNLIVNPGFESGITGWYTFSTDAQNSSETVVTTLPHSGSSSLKISINSSTVISAGALQSLTVIPLQRYFLEYYVRTDSVNMESSIYPYLSFGDTVVNYEYGLVPIRGTTGWRRFQSRFTIPQGTNSKLDLFFIFSGTRGSAYFDDISFTPVTDTAWSNFNIDLSGNAGLIKNFSGTNTGPVKTNGSIDLTTAFQQTSINYVRTHDYYGACDISTIFPDSSRSASDSTAYNFSSSDLVINGIVNAGSKILFRLGESFESPSLHNAPPSDMNKWADICLHIVKHYNEGWNNGYTYNIKEWEIWNEPDAPIFWSGTVNDFIKLYRLTSRKLKQHDGTLIIGGPAIASVFSEQFLNTFLDSVSAENLPFNFFSYHFYYIANPYHFKYVDSLAQAMLYSHGLSSAKRYVSEWNTLFFTGNISQLAVWHDDPYISSQIASVMNYWQDNGPDKAFFYRTDQYLFGLFDEWTGKYTFAGRTFQAVNSMNETPNRLPALGGDSLGKTILAGKSITGDSTNILISDCGSGANGYNVNLNNMAAGESYLYQLYRVVVADSLSELFSGLLTATNKTISVNAIPPYTDIIRLKKQSISGVRNLSDSKHSFIVFPNPATDKLTIVFPDNQITNEKIQICNSMGLLVGEIQVSHSTQINIIGLRKGLYFIRLKNYPDEVQKFIKQ